MNSVYIFIQKLNLDSLYLVDSLFLNVSGIFSSNLLFGMSLGSSFCCLATVVTFASIYFYTRLNCVLRSYESLIFSFISCLSLYLISNGALVFLDIFPLALIFLARELELFQSRFFKSKLILSYILEIYAYFAAGVLSFLYYILSSFFYPIKNLTIFKNLRVILFGLISSIIFYQSSNKSVIFDYPAEARLGDVSNFQRLGEVVFARERNPLGIIPEVYLSERYHSWSIFLIILGSIIFAFFIAKKIKSKDLLAKINSSHLLVIIFICFGLITNAYSISNYERSPEGLLYLLLPGLIWRAYPWLLPCILFFLFVMQISKFQNFNLKKYFLVPITVVFLLGSIRLNNQSFYKETYFKILDGESLDINFTPSNYLLEKSQLSAAYFKERSLEYKENFDLLTNCEVTSNVGQDKIKFLLDNNLATKWSSAGPQKVGDWVQIRCNKNFNFSRVSLNLGAAHTDFPRGIRLEVGKDQDNLLVVKDMPVWLGGINKTENGLPYYSGQNHVNIDFDKVQSGKIIKFTLLKGDSTFDWTIAEVKLYDS